MRNKRKEEFEKHEKRLMMEFVKKEEAQEEKHRLEKKENRHNPVFDRDWNTPGAGGYGSGGSSISYEDQKEKRKKRKKEQDQTRLKYESLDNRTKSLRKIYAEMDRKSKN